VSLDYGWDPVIVYASRRTGPRPHPGDRPANSFCALSAAPYAQPGTDVRQVVWKPRALVEMSRRATDARPSVGI